MKINRSTINDYINGKPVNEWSNQWIYHSIVNNQYLFEELPDEKREIIRRAAAIIENELCNFQPYNKDIWNIIFPGWEGIINNSTVYLVVGCPNPFDAMTRNTPEGEEVVIFDINRMLNYSEDFEKLLTIIKNLLTHEYCHTCLHTDYPVPKDNSSFIEKLQYICFDEGFAHLLSFKENINNVNWLEYDLLQKKKRAFDMLRDAVRAGESEHGELLLKANSGVFWDKFGAISGLFEIADIIDQRSFDYNKINEIYDRGPKDFLMDYYEKS